jgi:predicted transcriptional regulator
MTATELPDAIDVELEERTPVEAIDELLALVREGRTYMDEIADSLGVTAVKAEELVRVAERAGLLVRRGYSGMNLYEVELTRQGDERLPELSEREATLAEHDLNELDYQVLRTVDDLGKSSSKSILTHLERDLAPMKLIPIVNHLVQVGYLSESGLWRRYVAITTAGEETLEALSSLGEGTGSGETA